MGAKLICPEPLPLVAGLAPRACEGHDPGSGHGGRKRERSQRERERERGRDPREREGEREREREREREGEIPEIATDLGQIQSPARSSPSLSRPQTTAFLALFHK